MKITLKIALVLVAFASQARAVLVYNLVAPVTGRGQLGIIDTGSTGGLFDWTQGQSRVEFGQYQAKLFYDEAAGTLRQVGEVPLIVGPAFTLEKVQDGMASALTITQSFERDFLGFDTGFQPLTFTSATHAHASMPQSGVPLPPVNGSWSLVTGGHTYTGNFDYTIFGGFPLPFDMEFASDLSSITFGSVSGGSHFSTNFDPVRFTADNGVVIDLHGGISDFTDAFQWMIGPAVASVPDAGSTLGLLLFGLMGLACWRRT